MYNINNNIIVYYILCACVYVYKYMYSADRLKENYFVDSSFSLFARRVWAVGSTLIP